MIKLLENFWLKVLALIIGLLIWFHVATEKTYNYEVKLPVEEVDLKDSLTLAANPPESLLVTVSAKGKQLLRHQWRQDGLRINATRYIEGHHRITLNTSNTFMGAPSSNVTLDEVVFPTQVEFFIDEEGVVTVPITPDVVTVPDEGFAVNLPIKVEPENATLHGPKSLLGQFSTIFTKETELTGLRNDVKLTLPLLAPDNYGMWLDPDSADVTIEVVPVRTRVFEDLPVVVYNVPPGHQVTTDPPSVTVELTGPPDEIDQLDRSAITVSADFRQVNEFGDAPIKIDYPSNFRVRKSTTETVKITVTPNADTRN